MGSGVCGLGDVDDAGLLSCHSLRLYYLGDVSAFYGDDLAAAGGDGYPVRRIPEGRGASESKVGAPVSTLWD